MQKDTIKRLNNIKAGKSPIIFEEYLHKQLIVGLVEYLFELDCDIDCWDIICLEPLLERKTLKKYTEMAFDTENLSEKLDATVDAIRHVLDKYIAISLNSSLSRIPFFDYFLPTSKSKFREALRIFKDTRLELITQELQNEISPQIKSARKI